MAKEGVNYRSVAFGFIASIVIYLILGFIFSESSSNTTFGAKERSAVNQLKLKVKNEKEYLERKVEQGEFKMFKLEDELQDIKERFATMENECKDARQKSEYCKEDVSKYFKIMKLLKGFTQ